MGILLNYVGSFCEIKISDTYNIVCTGHVEEMTNEKIELRNMVIFGNSQFFDATITILQQGRGLQVYKAAVTAVHSDGLIEFCNIIKLVDTDRRAAYRAVVDLPALIIESKIGYNAMIKDMSVRGISLCTDLSLDTDSSIRVQFPIDNQLLDCNCCIIRPIGSNNYVMKKYGCEFERIDIHTQTVIKALITRKRTEFMQLELLR